MVGIAVEFPECDLQSGASGVTQLPCDVVLVTPRFLGVRKVIVDVICTLGVCILVSPVDAGDR